MKLNLRYNRQMYSSNKNITKLCEEWYLLYNLCLDAQLYTGAKMYKDKLTNFIDTSGLKQSDNCLLFYITYNANVTL